jgi:NADPH:quinone reductase-like Zn-dependent oxidoreductase
MKLRYKIAGGLAALVLVLVAALALVLSHTVECPPAPEVANGIETMQAVVYRCYGSPDVLALEDIRKPAPAGEEVLVKVHAAAVNPYDWHHLRGSPYLLRLSTGLGSPDDVRLGADFAGIVVEVGEFVTEFQPGDEVFGGASGAYAEYVTASPDRIARKPAGISFAEAASLPIAAITALQALRDNGQLQAGEKVLINGASGGVGTYAVQIAKSMGAEVYGVCSTRNVDMVRSLGADNVFDYKKEDYTESGLEFDLIIDMVGNHSLLANRRVLAPDGRFVIVGGAKGNWIAPLIAPLKAMILSPFVDQQMGMMIAKMNGDDLAKLADLMERGVLTSKIDRRYRLTEAADAIRYSEQGRARGKIIIDLE